MATTVNDYSLIESDNHADLVDAVCEAFKDGWQPHGAVCIWYEPPQRTSVADPIVHYAQALVKYER